jgi:hypothetical protein
LFGGEVILEADVGNGKAIESNAYAEASDEWRVESKEEHGWRGTAEKGCGWWIGRRGEIEGAGVVREQALCVTKRRGARGESGNGGELCAYRRGESQGRICAVWGASKSEGESGDICAMLFEVLKGGVGWPGDGDQEGGSGGGETAIELHFFEDERAHGVWARLFFCDGASVLNTGTFAIVLVFTSGEMEGGVLAQAKGEKITEEKILMVGRESREGGLTNSIDGGSCAREMEEAAQHSSDAGVEEFCLCAVVSNEGKPIREQGEKECADEE